MAQPRSSKRATGRRITDVAPGPALARKPMASARRVSLFARDVHTRLAPAAVDILASAAKVLTEGDVAGGSYAGSTMVTFDLARTADRISDPVTAHTATRLAAMYIADDRARAHARRLALREAVKTAGCELASTQIDVEARGHGAQLHLSLSVEAEARTPP